MELQLPIKVKSAFLTLGTSVSTVNVEWSSIFYKHVQIIINHVLE